MSLFFNSQMGGLFSPLFFSGSEQGVGMPPQGGSSLYSGINPTMPWGSPFSPLFFPMDMSAALGNMGQSLMGFGNGLSHYYSPCQSMYFNDAQPFLNLFNQYCCTPQYNAFDAQLAAYLWQQQLDYAPQPLPPCHTDVPTGGTTTPPGNQTSEPTAPGAQSGSGGVLNTDSNSNTALQPSQTPQQRPAYPTVSVRGLVPGQCFERKDFYFVKDGKALTSDELVALEGNTGVLSPTQLKNMGIRLLARDGTEYKLESPLNLVQGGVVQTTTKHYDLMSDSAAPKVLRDGQALTDEQLQALADTVNGTKDENGEIVKDSGKFPLTLSYLPSYNTQDDFSENNLQIDMGQGAGAQSASAAYVQKIIIRKNADGTFAMDVVTECRDCEGALEIEMGLSWSQPSEY